MKRRGRSAYAILRDMGYQGTRESVLAAVTAQIDATLGR